MPTSAEWLVFLGAAALFAIIPGPGILYVLARSLRGGRADGIRSSLGNGIGALAHVAAAAVGLSAVLAASATAFTVVKLLGAAYLIYLGLRALFERDHVRPDVPDRPARRRRAGRSAVVQGMITELLNPKTALFFLAFLPQFVDPAAGPVAPQMLVLGTLLVGLGVLSDGTYALLAAGAGRRLRSATATRRVLERTSGGVFVGLGVVAALAGEPRQR